MDTLRLPILCQQCMFYTDSTAWNCIKCNHVTIGSKLNVSRATNCTKCKEERQNLTALYLGKLALTTPKYACTHCARITMVPHLEHIRKVAMKARSQ